MNGIDNIIKRINDESDSAVSQIIAQAERDAAAIREEFEEKCAEKRDGIISRGEKAAAERESRLRGAYELDARKAALVKKQELISRAFEGAAKKLSELDDEARADALAALALRAADGKSGEIILSAAEKAAIGEKLLAKCAGNKGITLADETREIGGGLILRNGAAEVNCTFETLVSQLRDEMSREIADILFG